MQARRRPRPTDGGIGLRERWAAYAAAAWALLFALRGVYWAAGGTVGLGTLSEELQALAEAGDATVIGALWAVVGLLAVGVVLALTLAAAEPPTVPVWLPGVGGRTIPAWMLVLPASGAAGLLVVHGGLYISLLLGGTGSTVVLWYGLLWGPWFALGGVLFLLAADQFRRRTRRVPLGLGALTVGVVAGALVGAAPRLIPWLVGA